MQPYFVQYVGYWRFIADVDKCILLDDVNFIKGGWINRNCIEGPNGVAWITIHLFDASPNRKRRMKSTVLQSYSRHEGEEDVLQMFCRWIDEEGCQESFAISLPHDYRHEGLVGSLHRDHSPQQYFA